MMDEQGVRGTQVGESGSAPRETQMFQTARGAPRPQHGSGQQVRARPVSGGGPVVRQADSQAPARGRGRTQE